jgi:hypothetical protein
MSPSPPSPPSLLPTPTAAAATPLPSQRRHMRFLVVLALACVFASPLFGWVWSPPWASPPHPLAGDQRVVLCLFILNEHALFREWVAFHLAQGVDLIEVYDNGSEPPLSSVLGGLPSVTFRTNFSFSATPKSTNGHQGLQNDAYRDCLGRHAGTHTHVALVDVDEFLFPCAAAADAGTTLRQALTSQPVWSLACGKYGPTEYPGARDSLAVERHLYRAPVLKWWASNFFSLELLSWLTILTHPGCLQEGSGGVLCEETTPAKYTYDAAHVSAAFAKTIGGHGPPTWPAGLAPTGFTTRTTSLCCNHLFWRSTADALAKAAKNHNTEYRDRAADQGVVAWHLTVHDDAAVRFAPGARELLRRHPVPESAWGEGGKEG